MEKGNYVVLSIFYPKQARTQRSKKEALLGSVMKHKAGGPKAQIQPTKGLFC